MKTSFIERLIVIITMTALLLSVFLSISSKPILVIPLWVIIGNLSLALYILFCDLRSSLNKAFSKFVFSISAWALGVYIMNTIGNEQVILAIGRYMYIGVAFIPSTFLALSFVFPNKEPGFNSKKEIALYIPSLLFVLSLPTSLLIRNITFVAGAPRMTCGVLYPAFGVFIVAYILWAFIRLFRSFLTSKGQDRVQLKYLVIALFFTFIVALSTNLLLPAFGIFKYIAIGPLFSFAIISFMAYAILRNKLEDLYLIFQKGIVYSAASLAIIGIYYLIAVFSGQNVSLFSQNESVIALILAAFVVSITFQPMIEAIQHYTEKFLFNRLHEELQNQQMEISRLEEQVRRSEKLAALGTMAAGMAHEIKNPLSSIKVMSQLVSRKFGDPEYRKKFDEIMPKEISRIDRIVESLLGYTRTSKPNFEKMSLNEIVSETLDFLEDNIRRSEISLSFDEGDIPSVSADPQQIYQVLLNLLLNAIQASPGGKINISTVGCDQSVVVEIADSGCGIKKEDLPRLFDPFFTTKHTGIGLGLTIVHGIIEAHKGGIEVASVCGKGTAFRVTLPIFH